MKTLMAKSSRRFFSVALLVVPALCAGGCYTRLTTPKEAREFRGTYPELERGSIVMLENARDNLGNTFIMDLEVYMNTLSRFRDSGNEPSYTGEDLFRFRQGSFVDVKLPDHPGDAANGIFQVRPEGTIDIGPLHDFPMAGKTVPQVRKELAERLSRWYRSVDSENDLPVVSVNLPLNPRGVQFGGDNVDTGLGMVTVMALGGAGGGGQRPLRGNDTLVSIMAQSYSAQSDWHEIVVLRKIRTRKIHPVSQQPIEYYLMIIADLERIIYEDPNLNMPIVDGDTIYTHTEKAPIILEILNTARAIVNVHGDLTGVEGVLEDIFRRNF